MTPEVNLTIVLIGLTVGLSLYAWRNPGLLQRWLLNPYQVARRGQYERLLTSGFVHQDYAHLGFNMLTLYFFGTLVERAFGYIFDGWMGTGLFGLLYLVGIVVASLPTFFQHRQHPHYNSLGASGGVSAVVFAAIVLLPTQPIYLFFIPVGIPGFLLGALYLIYSALKARSPDGDQINHSAHLYGALFGALFTVLTVPNALANFFRQLSGWSLF